MDEYRVIKATSSEISQICELHRYSWNEVFEVDFCYPKQDEALEQWSQIISNESYLVLVAYREQNIVGFIACLSKSAFFEITDLFVLPQNRGSGVGRLLAKSAIKASDKDLLLWVAENNRSAIKLYKELGFRATGNRKAEPRRKDKACLIEMYRCAGV